MLGRFINKFSGKDSKPITPEIIGLGLGTSFEIDKLAMKLILDELTIETFDPTQIIQAVGIIELDGAFIYRFYTDDDAWLQVVAEGGQNAEHVTDVKFFHFYDTQDIESEAVWNQILNEEIGQQHFKLEDKLFNRVWTSASNYHNPVHMEEKTYDKSGDSSLTDQFTMLFERVLSDGRTESLFLSAEETIEKNGLLNRCLVFSTGITLTPSQITIHG